SKTRYEPYGNVASGFVPTKPDNIGFTGHVFDSNTGLVQMQQRYYDPIAGRFLSTDPVLADVSNGGNFGRYTYVSNNPFSRIDPDGQLDCASMGGNCTVISAGFSEKSHTALDIASFQPGAIGAIAAGANGILYLVEGNLPEAVINGGSAVLGIASDAGVVKATVVALVRFKSIGEAASGAGALERVIARNGGELVDGGARFATRRDARQAASELAGNLGSDAQAIRMRDFRQSNVPWGLKDSNRVIGRRSADGSTGWRDDFLGHPQFDMGPHVNVWNGDQSLHFFY
ncbi:RHS repeat-associated core domain-containing protein, partial [Ideonella dechloratans]